MRIVSVTLLCVLPVFLAHYPAGALRVEYDGGPIKTIVDDKIYVQGSLGSHVFEPIGVCSWCEEGVEVLITFSGYTRATLQPKSESFHGRPVPVLIIKDGRE